MSPFRMTERSTKLRRLRKTTRRSRVHVQTVGLNAEAKKVSPSRRFEQNRQAAVLGFLQREVFHAVVDTSIERRSLLTLN
jgi:hypothetical protein